MRTTRAVRAQSPRRWFHTCVAAASFAAAMVSSSMQSWADAPNSVRMSIKGFMFSPQSLNVKAGSTVTWTNMGQEPHTIVDASGLFRSGAIDTAETFSFKFDKPGTYQYVCTIHPRMVGTIVVE